MTIASKKLQTGFSMPVFGLGTYGMGGRRERDMSNDDAADIGAIRAAIEMGVTHIDTAESYATGYTETLVGKAIANYDRSKLFLVSKIHLSHLNYPGVFEATKNILERLGTDYLDLLLMHRYPGDEHLAETIKAFDELKVRGLIKNIGVSNFTKEHLAAAQALTKNKIVCNQVHYGLISRQPEVTGLLDYCQKNDVMLVAYRPVEKGIFTAQPPAVLQAMCKKYGKTPSQVAINWLISQPNVVTIAKSRSVEHLQDNLGAIGWSFEPEDIELLRREYPNQEIVSSVVPLG